MKSVLIKIILPNKSIKYIESYANESFGDLSDYILKTNNFGDQKILIPLNQQPISENCPIGKILHNDHVLTLVVKNIVDYDSKQFIESIQKLKEQVQEESHPSQSIISPVSYLTSSTSESEQHFLSSSDSDEEITPILSNQIVLDNFK